MVCVGEHSESNSKLLTGHLQITKKGVCLFDSIYLQDYLRFIIGDEDTYDLVHSCQVKRTRILAGHHLENGVCGHGGSNDLLAAPHSNI